MSRSSNAARAQTAHAQTAHVQTEGRAPANDTEDASERDASRLHSVLTDAQRARYLLLAARLRVAASKRIPKWVNAHLDWMDGIVSTAWSDRADMAKVALGGHPITEAELHEFSLRIEYAREAVADEAVPVNGAPASNKPELMRDEALDAEIRLCQSGVCDGLVPWFPFSAAMPDVVARQRAAVRTVRRYRGKAELVSNSLLLFKVCSDAQIDAWLRGLPKGEAALLERLRVLHKERVRRNKGARPANAAPATVADLPLRAYLLAKEPVARITAAGRYLIKGRPERAGDYAGFTRPSSPKRVDDQPAKPTDDAEKNPVVR